MKTPIRWVIKPEVPVEVYTDRREHIDYLFNEAREATRRRTMSTVLLGLRRMGKTEIFKRVVNRLFYEQDHADPGAVVPVYYAFPDEKIDRWEFSIRYVENFLRWYTAFKLNNPDLISERYVSRGRLVEFIRENIEVTHGLTGALNTFEWLMEKDVTIPEQSALTTPRHVSDHDDATVAMFLDEFQNTHLPQYTFRVVGFMQEAVESNTCPHFVTGSAMGMLNDILGRGALFGRFMSHPIEPLTDYYGAELAGKAARYYGASVEEEMAPIISERCGGNPFYITAVARQAARRQKPLDGEEALNELLAVDISSGFIWAELYDQVSRWIARTNEHGVTKWVLYLAALEKGKRIDVKRIQRELWRQDRQEVDPETIRNALVKLSRGDLLDYQEVGGWFSKLNDPILEEFLKVWGGVVVKGESQNTVRNATVQKYKRARKRFDEYKGYLAEVYMIQILWNSQRKTLPGGFFHSREDIRAPDRFFYIEHRGKMGEGKELEVDIYAAAGLDVWIAESKWWTKNKVGPRSVERLLAQAEMIREREGEDTRIRVWLFAHDGFTEKAEALMQKSKVLWSTREDLDALLAHVKLRTLPDI
ncbi:MAG: hypothetical protein GY859_08515 [Desulfobacterales bacterium]|nr:hypothetical protein [Desulfobacterales bacterium]